MITHFDIDIYAYRVHVYIMSLMHNSLNILQILLNVKLNAIIMAPQFGRWKTSQVEKKASLIFELN